MVAELEQRLPEVHAPICILQGTEDRVVKPESAKIIEKKIGSPVKSLHMVPSKRHGLINEDVGNTHDVIFSFLTSIPEAHKSDGPDERAEAAQP
jgi:alpha-beta hydrolase superfamily lysophospholipase